MRSSRNHASGSWDGDMEPLGGSSSDDMEVSVTESVDLVPEVPETAGSHGSSGTLGGGFYLYPVGGRRSGTLRIYGLHDPVDIEIGGGAEIGSGDGSSSSSGNGAVGVVDESVGVTAGAATR